jgi:hypothetical protein
VILAADLLSWLYFKRRITARFIVHLLIMVCLISSLVIDGVHWLKFLSLFIFVRIPEIPMFSSIVKAQLRPFRGLYLAFTFIKIFYLFALVSHILGCLFYAIDD